MLLLGLALDESPRQLFQLAGERQQNHGGEHVEHRVAEGDAHCAHRLVHEGEVEDHVPAVEQNQADHGADDIKGDMDHRHTLGIAVDADGAQQGRDAGADILAHDDGDGHAIGDGSRQRQGLQYAHRCCGGLDDACKHSAHQHAQKGIVESGEDTGKLRHIGQRAHSLLHQLHTVHQNGKAHHDPADIPALLLFGAHDENDAHQGHQGREVLGLEEIHKNIPALQPRQREDPRSEGRSDVGAHDDADGLPQLHDTGVH